MNIAIHVSSESDAPIYLGTVEVLADMTLTEANDRLADAWDEFQATQPETDSAFVSFLEKTHPWNLHFAYAEGDDQFYARK